MEKNLTKNLRLSFRKGDLLAALLVVLVAAGIFALFLPGRDAQQSAAVQIWQDGRLVRELPLNTDAHIPLSSDYSNLVSIENGRACILESDCPGADCVHSGWISSPGRSIVCLPNRVEVRITGTGDVDFAVR